MPTVDSILTRAAFAKPDAVAVWEWESGRRVDYRTLNKRVSALAAFLLSQGVKPRDRIGVHLPNGEAFLIAHFGAMRAGGVSSLVNYRLNGSEAARQLKLARVAAIVTTAERAAEFLGMEELRGCIIVVTGESTPGMHSLSTAVAAEDVEVPALGDFDDEDVIARFTSGSTGAPKGVLVSHRAWLIRATSLLTETIQVDPGSTTMVLGPLSHQAGLFILPTMLRHGTLLAFDQFDIDKVIAALKTGTVSRTQMVPTMLRMFLGNAEAREALRTSGLKQVIYGGSPVEARVIEEVLELMPNCDFIQSYGSHEAGSISYLDGTGHRDPILRRSAGRPYLAASVRILPIPDSDIGEIEVRAPWAPTARITEKGRERIDDGWIATGDLGELRDGYVILKDRANDVIISGGFNIYPMEVEDVINAYSQVLASAVVSVPDEKWGEKVIAFVVPRGSQSLDEEGLRNYCRENLSGFKVPKEFRTSTEIPLNANGKPDRRKLSNPLWLGRERRIN